MIAIIPDKHLYHSYCVKLRHCRRRLWLPVTCFVLSALSSVLHVVHPRFWYMWKRLDLLCVEFDLSGTTYRSMSLLLPRCKSLKPVLRLTCLRLPSLNYFVQCHRDGSCYYWHLNRSLYIYVYLQSYVLHLCLRFVMSQLALLFRPSLGLAQQISGWGRVESFFEFYTYIFVLLFYLFL